MLYFKQPSTGEVFGYETEEERARFGAPELLPLTPEEILAHLTPPAPTKDQLIEQLQRQTKGPRWMSVTVIELMEKEAKERGAAIGLAPDVSLATLRATNSLYRQLKAIEEQIQALESQP